MKKTYIIIIGIITILIALSGCKVDEINTNQSSDTGVATNEELSTDAPENLTSFDSWEELLGEGVEETVDDTTDTTDASTEEPQAKWASYEEFLEQVPDDELLLEAYNMMGSDTVFAILACELYSNGASKEELDSYNKYFSDPSVFFIQSEIVGDGTYGVNFAYDDERGTGYAIYGTSYGIYNFRRNAQYYGGALAFHYYDEQIKSLFPDLSSGFTNTVDGRIFEEGMYNVSADIMEMYWFLEYVFPDMNSATNVNRAGLIFAEEYKTIVMDCVINEDLSDEERANRIYNLICLDENLSTLQIINLLACVKDGLNQMGLNDVFDLTTNCGKPLAEIVDDMQIDTLHEYQVLLEEHDKKYFEWLEGN